MIHKNAWLISAKQDLFLYQTYSGTSPFTLYSSLLPSHLTEPWALLLKFLVLESAGLILNLMHVINILWEGYSPCHPPEASLWVCPSILNLDCQIGWQVSLITQLFHISSTNIFLGCGLSGQNVFIAEWAVMQRAQGWTPLALALNY